MVSHTQSVDFVLKITYASVNILSHFYFSTLIFVSFYEQKIET